MTEGRQLFTAEIKTLAKGPSTYDPLETQSARSDHSRNKLRTRPFEPEADLQTFIPPSLRHSSNSALASFRSSVSKPSVNRW